MECMIRDSADDEVRSSLLPEQNMSAAEEAPSAERRVYGTGNDVRHLARVDLKESDCETGPTAEYLQLLDGMA